MNCLYFYIRIVAMVMWKMIIYHQILRCRSCNSAVIQGNIFWNWMLKIAATIAIKIYGISSDYVNRPRTRLSRKTVLLMLLSYNYIHWLSTMKINVFNMTNNISQEYSLKMNLITVKYHLKIWSHETDAWKMIHVSERINRYSSSFPKNL